MKKLSLADVFGARIKPLAPFRLQPPTVHARPMRTEQFAEGVIHFSSYRAAYLEPPPKVGQRRVLNAHGLWVTEHFHIPQPWKRVTPKAVRPGRVRRDAKRSAA
ncbi:MAG TPA: hypothetical protein VJQ52_03945 [Steroidobacteraceae bacterium]|nr:hypothetical protein [Steroidobacteraceae bacterium]